MIDHLILNYGGWYGPPGDCDEPLPFEIELDAEQGELVEQVLRDGGDIAGIPEIADLITEAVAELKEEKIDILRDNEDSYTMKCLGYQYDVLTGDWVFAHEDDPDFEPADPFEGGYRFIADVDEEELWEQLDEDPYDDDDDSDEDEF